MADLHLLLEPYIEPLEKPRSPAMVHGVTNGSYITVKCLVIMPAFCYYFKIRWLYLLTILTKFDFQ